VKCVIGIDPGASGAAVSIDENRQVEIIRFSKTPMSQVASQLQMLTVTHKCIAYMEQVHSMPSDKRPQLAQFMKNSGRIEGILLCCQIEIRFVDSGVWQRKFGVYGLRSKFVREGMSESQARSAAKNRIQQVAKELSGNEKLTLDQADAYLIAMFGYHTVFGE
jgi:hypothetical protein